MKKKHDHSTDSPNLNSLNTFVAGARRFREEHARRYRLVNGRDTSYLRSEGWLSRMMDRLRGEEYVTR